MQMEWPHIKLKRFLQVPLKGSVLRVIVGDGSAGVKKQKTDKYSFAKFQDLLLKTYGLFLAQDNSILAKKRSNAA
tara:strand:- start:155 stop:379 length:225 start_codon:yes stop_codon:yes gene_type:complete